MYLWLSLNWGFLHLNLSSKLFFRVVTSCPSCLVIPQVIQPSKHDIDVSPVREGTFGDIEE
jgi:hypothetical protein